MPLPPPKVPRKLLIAGLLMTFVPQIFLYTIRKSEEKKAPVESDSETMQVEQLMEQHTTSHFYLKGFLWTVLASGVGCLVIAFKKTLPNPEDKLFEEEWDKKGR